MAKAHVFFDYVRSLKRMAKDTAKLMIKAIFFAVTFM